MKANQHFLSLLAGLLFWVVALVTALGKQGDLAMSLVWFFIGVVFISLAWQQWRGSDQEQKH